MPRRWVGVLDDDDDDGGVVSLPHLEYYVTMYVCVGTGFRRRRSPARNRK